MLPESGGRHYIIWDNCGYSGKLLEDTCDYFLAPGRRTETRFQSPSNTHVVMSSACHGSPQSEPVGKERINYKSDASQPQVESVFKPFPR